jgi:uncharacterized membrane protein
LIGLLGYASIFLVVWLRSWSDTIEQYTPELLGGLVGIAFLFTMGLTGLEMFVIHAFCQYCLYSAVIVLVMAILAVSLIISTNREQEA